MKQNPFLIIEINNLTRGFIDENALREIAKTVLKSELEISTPKKPSATGQKFRNIELSIALIGSGRMREINKRYRGKDRATDVLAFPEPKSLPEKFESDSNQRTRGLGEIVICPKEVKKNAKRFDSTFKKELAQVLIHGILHLLGYDHEKSKEGAEEMEKKQDYYLKILKN